MQLDVSILTPVFGDAPYLDEALESIAQEMEAADSQGIEVETVLVLDRPSFRVRSRIAAFEDKMPRVWVLESRNAGLVCALNLGLSRINSRYVARFDSDDVMLPGRLSTQMGILDQDPELVLLGGQIQRWSRDKVLSTSALPLDHSAIIRSLLRGRHAISHSSCMLRTSTVNDLGGYRTLPHAEDWDLYLRMTEVGRLANTPHAVTRYRFHAASSTSRNAHLTQQGIQLAIASHGRAASDSAQPQVGELLEWRRRARAWLRAKAQVLYRKSLERQSPHARLTLLTASGLLDPGGAITRIRRDLSLALTGGSWNPTEDRDVRAEAASSQ